MAQQSFFRRHRRLFTWLFLIVILVALGLVLHGEILPEPRCIISMDSPAALGDLSPDGSRVVTYGGTQEGAWVGPVRVWDTASGRELAAFPDFRSHVTDALAGRNLSRSRRFLPEVGKKGNLLLLDVTGSRLLDIPLPGLKNRNDFGRVAGAVGDFAELRRWQTLRPRFHFSPAEDLLADSCSGKGHGELKRSVRQIPGKAHNPESPQFLLRSFLDGTAGRRASVGEHEND